MIDLIKNIITCMKLKNTPLDIKRWGDAAYWDCNADAEWLAYKNARGEIYSASKTLHNILSRWNII